MPKKSGVPANGHGLGPFEHGVLEASLLYECPLTDVTPQGPEVLFTPARVDELMDCTRSSQGNGDCSIMTTVFRL